MAEKDFETLSKKIIVYCASPVCDTSPTVARELADRGFDNIHDYEAGMSDWNEAGHPVDSGHPARETEVTI